MTPTESDLVRGAREILDISALILRGGAGSGHFAHKGVPGQRGGSAPGPGGGTVSEAGGTHKGVPGQRGGSAPGPMGLGTSWQGGKSFAHTLTNKSYDSWVTMLSKKPLAKLRAWQDVVSGQMELLRKNGDKSPGEIASIEQMVWELALTDAVARKAFANEFPAGSFGLPAWLKEWRAKAEGAQ